MNVLTRTRFSLPLAPARTRTGAASPLVLLGAGAFLGFALASAPLLFLPAGAAVGYLVTGGTTKGMIWGAAGGWLAMSLAKK